jgi:transcriptional regulator with XRE-family HTH domain
MSTRPRTDYEAFEASSKSNRRLLRQEELILDVTETLWEMFHRAGLTKADLARRLGKSKAFVSQLFAGNRNLTLRTLADVADSLGYRIRVRACKDEASRRGWSTLSEEPMPVAVARHADWHLRGVGTSALVSGSPDQGMAA